MEMPDKQLSGSKFCKVAGFDPETFKKVTPVTTNFETTNFPKTFRGLLKFTRKTEDFEIMLYQRYSKPTAKFHENYDASRVP